MTGTNRDIKRDNSTPTGTFPTYRDRRDIYIPLSGYMCPGWMSRLCKMSRVSRRQGK